MYRTSLCGLSGRRLLSRLGFRDSKFLIICRRLLQNLENCGRLLFQSPCQAATEPNDLLRLELLVLPGVLRVLRNKDFREDAEKPGRQLA